MRKNLVSFAVWGMVLAGTLATAQLSTVEAASSAFLQQGMVNYNKGYIQKAIPLFRKAVQQSPNSEVPLVWLGKAYKKQGGALNLQSSIDSFERALFINPNNVEALTALGEVYSYQAKTRGKALEMLIRADKIKPGEPSVIKALAQTLYWNGQYDDALAVVEPVADRFTKDKAWMSTYASILARTGNSEKAIRIFEQDLNVSRSKDFYLKQAYALALFQAGNKPQALSVFDGLKTDITRMKPDQQTSYILSLAGIAYEMELYEESLRLDQSLPPSAIQNDPSILMRMGRSLARLQRTPEAVDMFQRLYKSGQMAPSEKVEYADYLVDLNLAPENLPSPDVIESLYQEAIRDTPNNGRIYLAMARYYSKQPDASESALRAYWQALKGTSFKDQVPLKREFLDYLKSGKVSPPAAEKTFQELITEAPTDTWIKGAYAEFLSYQPPRRPEAIRLYLNLIAEEPGDKDKWRMPLERVIGWMKPSVEMIPTYQEVLKLYPDSKEGQLALARAYQLQPETKMASLQLYQQLVKAYPEDQKIKKEWAGALLGDEAHRREALAILRKLVEENPNDLSIKIAYAKLLSYDQKYGRALELFEEVLAQEPDNRDALLGKAYTLMFDYQRYKALGMFEQLRKAYPEDIEVALGLAEAERAIGRYDKALRLIKEIKPLLNWDFEGAPGINSSPTHGIPKTTAILVDYETPYQPTFGRGNGLDYSVMPFAETVVPDSSLGKQYLGGSYASSTPGTSSKRKVKAQQIQEENDENEYQGTDVERAPSQAYPKASPQRQAGKSPERDFYMEGDESGFHPKKVLPFWARKNESPAPSRDSVPITSPAKAYQPTANSPDSTPKRVFAPPPSLRDLRMMEAASDSDSRRSSRPSRIVDPSNEKSGGRDDSQEVYVNVSTVDPIDRTLIEKGAGAPGFEMLGSGSTISPRSTEISPDSIDSSPAAVPSRDASGDGAKNSTRAGGAPGSIENSPENASTQEGQDAERSPQPVSESGDDLAQGSSSDPAEYQEPSLDSSVTPQPKRTGRTASMNKELDDVNSAIETIRAIQKNSTSQIHTMHNTLAGSKENDLGAVDGLENEEDRSTLKAFGQYAAIDQDTNPLITQLGRFKTESKNLETRIGKELRPMARAGYAYMVQDGEKSTVRLRGWSIPNQMSLSLTPQLRIRGGITPAMVAQPRVSTSPRSNTYQTYSMGLTAKYWDHFTVDGDLAIIDFNTTDNANITYQANGKYDFNDKISLRVGGRRFQNQNSLLSFAGYRPLRGPFKDTLVGQAMENAVFVELNTLPFRNTDFNLGYEFAHVTGHEIKSNNRNQAFLSVGYTQPYLKHHYARLGYELLYFGYSEPATLGYFNLRSTGPNTPLATINPINLAPSASVFGGYFSPKYFFLNSLRADLRGSFFNKFLEYRLGGGVGIQTFSNGSGIFTQTPSAFACNADANVIMNFTDWLSGYLHGEFIKGGGAFNRVRFGGGVIVRPNIPALSPVFGKI